LPHTPAVPKHTLSSTPRRAVKLLRPWYQRPLTLILAVVVVGWAVVATALGLVMDAVYANRILPGSVLAGHNLSGMTPAQAGPVLDLVQSQIALDITVGDATQHGAGSDMGVSVDRTAIMTSLMDASKQTFWIYRSTRPPQIPLTVSIDPARFNAWLASSFPDQILAPVNAGVAYDQDAAQFDTTPSVPGTGASDTDLGVIAATLATHGGTGAFTIAPVPIPASVTDDQAVNLQTWLNQRLQAQCSLTVDSAPMYTLTRSDIASVTAIQSDSSGVTPRFDTGLIDAFLTSTIVPLVNRAPVDEEALTDEAGHVTGIAQAGTTGRTLINLDTLSATIALCLTSSQPSTIELAFDTTPFTTLDTVSLSPANAAVQAQITYLLAHVSSYNTEQWGDYNENGGDCANFTSQGLYVRGIPMDDTWYSHGPGAASTAWTFAPSMDSWLDSTGWDKLDLDQLDQLKLGDIGVFDWNLDGRADHVMTVSRIDKSSTGTLTVYFASHNDDGAYRNLTDVITIDHPNANAWFYSVPLN